MSPGDPFGGTHSRVLDFNYNGPAGLHDVDENGFHIWSGGTIPVEALSRVEVKQRGGFTRADRAGPTYSALRLDWEHLEQEDGIVAFRSVEGE